MKKCILAVAVSAMLLCACGQSESSKADESSADMTYIKTSVLYDTLMDMYNAPENYLGKKYHIVGTLYTSEDDDGTKIYSVYARQMGSNEGIGLELDWSDFSSLENYDKIMVEGTLEQDQGTFHGNETEYLVLRVSALEKRD